MKLLFCNKCFDMSVLRYELDQMDLCYPDLEYYCTLVLSRACWPGLYSPGCPTWRRTAGSRFAITTLPRTPMRAPRSSCT